MEYVALWMMVPMLILVMVGYPLGFVMGGVGLIFGLVFWNWFDVSLMFAYQSYALQIDYLLLAIPLFLFMGSIMEKSGLADGLYHALHIWLGPLRGGLAMATILICTLFAAATGVAGASITMMGLLALPAMLKRGYDEKLAVGAVITSATLGILIPPSFTLVLYGAWAEISIGKLFMACFIPGLVLSGLYVAYVLIRTGFQPKLGPPLPPEERRMPLKQKTRLLVTGIIPPIFLILVALGTILLGWATPTEAAAMGAVGAMIVAAINRRLTWSVVKGAAYETAKVCGMISVIVIGSACFMAVFMALGGVQDVERLVLGAGLGPIGILAVTMGIVLILGALIDPIAIIMICVPIFRPLIDAAGFDPLWFAVLFNINIQIAYMSPPFGSALFLMKAVRPEISMATLIRSTPPWMALQTLGLIIVVFVPPLALWLPSVMIK
jgi:tripartite ATP-independent transporter DctM subunit